MSENKSRKTGQTKARKAEKINRITSAIKKAKEKLRNE